MAMLAEIQWNQGMIAVVMVFSVPICAIIGGVWYKIERTRSDNDLKRTMVERGMSAEEIERVIAAKTPDKDDDDEKKAK
jgi:hypothetical protein